MRNLDREGRVRFINKHDPADMDGIELGLWLGYPPCCVLNFAGRVASFRAGLPLQPVAPPFYGTGYVPCAECAARDPDELRAQIAADRVCPEPFPLYDVDVGEPA